MAEGSVVISPRGVERLRSGHLWVYRSDVRIGAGRSGASCASPTSADASRVAPSTATNRRSPSAFSRAKTCPWTAPSSRNAFAAPLPIANSWSKIRKPTGSSTAKPTCCPRSIVDRYGDYLVVQTLSQATERHQRLFVEILVEMFSPRGVLERNDPKVRLLEGLEQRVSVLHGEVPAEILAQGKRRDIRLRPAAKAKRPGPSSTSAKITGCAAVRFGRSARLLQLSGRLRAYGRGQMRAR